MMGHTSHSWFDMLRRQRVTKCKKDHADGGRGTRLDSYSIDTALKHVEGRLTENANQKVAGREHRVQ